MSIEMMLGRGQQVAGKLFELWGRLIGDESCRSHGYQLVAIGQMRVLGGRAAALLRYCTPRQALEVQPVLDPPRGIRSAGRAP